MNFTRLNYDTCTYKTNLRSSVGPGDYMLATPTIECQACFVADPLLAPKGKGVAACTNKPLVDVDSELIGISRKASRCPSDKYIPTAEQFCTTNKLADCRAIPLEDTRVSNPPCTLRSTGWNRWEWLCQNPQDKALIPFDFNISNRIVVKDNHRPCVQKPVSQTPILPPGNSDDGVYVPKSYCGNVSNDIPGVHWRKSCEYGPYNVRLS